MKWLVLLSLLSGCVRGVLPPDAPPNACHRERVGLLTWQNVCDLSAWSSK